MDVLSASWSSDGVEWHENDGNQNFTAHTITREVGVAYSVYSVDIDGDGDMDVLSGCGYSWDGIIYWYENDGNQYFSTHTITWVESGYAAGSVYAADVDCDGDMDVLSAFIASGGIEWYENDGNQNFTAHSIAMAGDRSVFSVDIDDDGDMDVLSASGNKIVWYENMLITGIETKATSIPEKFILHQNYPNPFNPQTMIEYQLPQTCHVRLVVYNLLGQEIATLLDQVQQTGQFNVVWDGKDNYGRVVPSGVYFYRLETENFSEMKSMILLE